VEPRRTFRYGHSFFLLRALLLASLFVGVLLFLSLLTSTPGSWLGLLAGLLALYLLVYGFTPLLTSHTLLRSRVILRQGWYFRCIIPFEDTEAIGPWEGAPSQGLRASLARRTLFVVGAPVNLISIRLKTPRRFAQVLFAAAAEIVFDVDDRDAFLAAVEERKTEGTPLPAAKIPILPGRR